MEPAHLAADDAFGSCSIPECPNYIGHHPAHREATDQQLDDLLATHQHQGRSASLRDGLRPPLTLVRTEEQG